MLPKSAWQIVFLLPGVRTSHLLLTHLFRLVRMPMDKEAMVGITLDKKVPSQALVSISYY
jgi:hypothetical protein